MSSEGDGDHDQRQRNRIWFRWTGDEGLRAYITMVEEVYESVQDSEHKLNQLSWINL